MGQRHLCRVAVLGFVFLAFASGFCRADQPVLDVWPAGKMPGETGKFGEENIKLQKHGDGTIQIMGNVTKPTLTVFLAPKDKNTGACVVVAPGGGYSILAWDLEGTEVAQWLNSIGVNAVVLKYRVPARPGQANYLAPLMDAQRGMSIVRGHAKEWGIDENRIGMLGFSAGGNLTAMACTNYNKRAYEPLDDTDKINCRPDFGVLVYPAWLINDKTNELKPEFAVDKNTPQMFMAHAADDGITANNSMVMAMALKKAGVASEVHIFSGGGHGFGLRPTTQPTCKWPDRCGEWMKARGIIK